MHCPRTLVELNRQSSGLPLAFLSLSTFGLLLLTSCATGAQNLSGRSEFKAQASGANPDSGRSPYVKPSLSEENPIVVVYPSQPLESQTTSNHPHPHPHPHPPQPAKIAASSTFIVGALLPGLSLTVNGTAATVNKQGFFAHVVSLNQGKNVFKLTASNSEGKVVCSRTVEVLREAGRIFISGDGPLKLDGASAEPSEDRGLSAGELIEFAVRGTPNSSCFVMLGKKKITLYPFASLKTKNGRAALNRGMEAAYGQVFQRYARNNPDLYIGLYRLESQDQFNQEQPLFCLEKAGKAVTLKGKGRITVVRQPVTAHTLRDDTITRATPDQARLTPLAEGVRLLVDGYQGDNIRCLLSPRKHVWIKKDDLQFEGAAAIPNSVARTIIVKKDDYGESIVLPLSQRLPYSIEQELKPNKIVVKLYGVQADTDWAYQAPAELGSSKLLDDVGFKQNEDGVYELTVNLNSQRQWGYFADYEDNNFVLHVKRPPQLAIETAPPTNTNILRGLTICLDPGHGGGENGAIGCSGEREADLNLGIALKLRDLLKVAGASVVMTREGDQDVSLADRTALANERKVDLLISIHNNALPDGRDPMKEHGTSSYWYHKQSKELARALKNGLVRECALPDIGDRWQNLALCRPTAMQAVLVEVGFVVNPDEYASLIDPAFQQKAAQGIFNGLVSYLE